jgi:hypothetical protein
MKDRTINIIQRITVTPYFSRRAPTEVIVAGMNAKILPTAFIFFCENATSTTR